MNGTHNNMNRVHLHCIFACIKLHIVELDWKNSRKSDYRDDHKHKSHSTQVKENENTNKLANNKLFDKANCCSCC